MKLALQFDAGALALLSKPGSLDHSSQLFVAIMPRTAAVNFAEDLSGFAEDSLVAFNKAQKLWKSAAGEPGKSDRSHR